MPKSFALNLEKSTETLKLCLSKAGVTTPPPVEVCFDMDVSGSFERDHLSGMTNAVMNRLVPWGIIFDPDKKLDLFTFSSREESAYYVGEVTAENCQDYIRNNVIRKVPGWNGGTKYHHVIKKNLQLFGWLPDESANPKPKKVGFFKRLFGNSSTPEQVVEQAAPRKSMIIFVTDGECEDYRETHELLQFIQDSGFGVYIMMFGIQAGPEGRKQISSFSAKHANVGHFFCDDIRDFDSKTDEEINEELISEKLVKWLNA